MNWACSIHCRIHNVWKTMFSVVFLYDLKFEYYSFCVAFIHSRMQVDHAPQGGVGAQKRLSTLLIAPYGLDGDDEVTTNLKKLWFWSYIEATNVSPVLWSTCWLDVGILYPTSKSGALGMHWASAKGLKAPFFGPVWICVAVGPVSAAKIGDGALHSIESGSDSERWRRSLPTVHIRRSSRHEASGKRGRTERGCHCLKAYL